MSVGLDATGHFLGCATHGCDATRCADARYQRDHERERLARGEAPAWMYRPCALCGSRMHPAQNSRRLVGGIVCMPCYDFEMTEPRYLREPPRDDPSVN